MLAFRPPLALSGANDQSGIEVCCSSHGQYQTRSTVKQSLSSEGGRYEYCFNASARSSCLPSYQSASRSSSRHRDLIRESSSSAVLTFRIPYALTSWEPCVTGNAGAAETRSGNTDRK